METQIGTIPRLVQALSKGFSYLEEKLQDEGVVQLFTELGFTFPDDIENDTNFSNALQDVLDATGAIITEVSTLNTHIQNEDYIEITNSTIVLITNIDTLQDRFDTLSTNLNGVTVNGISNNDLSNFSTALAENLISYLTIKYLEGYYPTPLKVMEFFGLVERNLIETDYSDPAKPQYIERKLHFERFKDLFGDTANYFQNFYGWGTSNLDSNLLLERIHDLLFYFHIPFALETGQNPNGYHILSFFFGQIQPYGSPLTGIELVFSRSFNSGLAIDMPFVYDNWKLQLEADGSIQPGASVIFEPNKVTFVPPSGQVDGKVLLNLFMKSDDGSPYYLFGHNGGSSLTIGEAILGIGSTFTWNSSTSKAEGNFLARLGLKDGQLKISSKEGDGFLSKVLPLEIESNFDFSITYSLNEGFLIEGGLGIVIIIPIHKTILGINFSQVYISGTFDGGDILTTLSADFDFSIGPFAAVISQLGIKGIFKPEKGNLGPLNASLGFKPPNGIGLTLDAAAVKGGGYLFFDHDNHSYAGVAELSIKDKIALKAIGLISTRMPDGSKGFSMLLIITAEFTPINIGFGFTLNGVGGLVGIHRTMLLDVLRTGVKTGAIANILFPVDPVKNAPALIASIGSVFPVAQGRFAFGIMGKFGWGTPTLITIDLGLIIEVPNPVRFAILGVLRVALPSEDTKTIRINVNFLGTIEFEKKQIAFDASIFDSQLGEVTLTGDMALRIGWGNNKNFLLSVGGFHPSFQAPPSLLYLSRITVNFLSQDKLSLVLTTYMAVTSNTAQFGAKIALDGRVTDKLTFNGHVSLDALFHFKPFHMDVLFEAYLALLWKGDEKMSISVSASLTGPSNWVMNGEAEAKILGVKFKVAVAAEWGRKETDTLPGIDVAPLLLAALDDKRNWEANLPANKPPLVKLRKYAATNPVVHPQGQIKISQKQVPLNVVVQKFGSQPANDAGTFVINTLTIGSSSSNSIAYTKEDFAPAQFREMSDTAKLSSPSFTQFDSGAVVGNSTLKGVHLATREIKYEVSILGSTASIPKHEERPEVLEAAARASAAARTPLASVRVTKSALAPLEMTVLEEKYGVVNSFDLRIHTGTVLYPTMAQALDKYTALVNADPLMKNELRVIPEFEITP